MVSGLLRTRAAGRQPNLTSLCAQLLARAGAGAGNIPGGHEKFSLRTWALRSSWRSARPRSPACGGRDPPGQGPGGRGERIRSPRARQYEPRTVLCADTCAIRVTRLCRRSRTAPESSALGPDVVPQRPGAPIADVPRAPTPHGRARSRSAASESEVTRGARWAAAPIPGRIHWQASNLSKELGISQSDLAGRGRQQCGGVRREGTALNPRSDPQDVR